MAIILQTVNECNSVGSKYFRLSKSLGLKITLKYWDKFGNQCDSNLGTYIQKEIDLINRARKSKSRGIIIPKVYGTMTVHLNNKDYPGILMEHIEGKECRSKDIPRILSKIKFPYNDARTEHFLKVGKKVAVLDFSPSMLLK